jgi:hypothetical protein
LRDLRGGRGRGPEEWGCRRDGKDGMGGKMRRKGEREDSEGGEEGKTRCQQCSRLKKREEAHHSLALLDIHLVTNNNEGEVLRVPRRRLDQELVPPAIERLETLARVDVVHQDAAIRSTVEGDTEGLETLLAGCVPELEDGEES